MHLGPKRHRYVSGALFWVFLACRPVPLHRCYPPCEQGLAAVGVLSCHHLVVTIELEPKKEEKKWLVS